MYNKSCSGVVGAKGGADNAFQPDDFYSDIISLRSELGDYKGGVPECSIWSC